MGFYKTQFVKKRVIRIMELFIYPLPVLRSLATSIYLSCQLFYGEGHRGKKVNCLAEMCSYLANQLWPCAAVGKGVANQRGECSVGNQDILTQGNGNVMDMLRKAQKITSQCTLASVASPVLPHWLINPKYSSCLSLVDDLVPTPTSLLLSLFLYDCLCLSFLVAEPLGKSPPCKQDHVASVIKVYLCLSSPGKRCLSLLLVSFFISGLASLVSLE